MSDTKIAEQSPETPSEITSALFAHLVVQQANMAMMLMGNTPHPETGQTMRDLEAAKLFIDMLEMLQAKTKGNRTPQEETMLKQTLMTVRMAFVEAANSANKPEKPATPPPSASAQAPNTAPESGIATPSSAPAEESHKKFTKKY
jgi:uncharacterized protein YccT (UPF0319 family)